MTILTSLTPEQSAERLKISDKRVSHLDNILKAFPPTMKAETMTTLGLAVKHSMKKLFRTLVELEVISYSQCHGAVKKASLMDAETAQLFRVPGQATPTGVAIPKRAEIFILDQLALAPKEVVELVVNYACLSLIYPLVMATAKPLVVRNDVSKQYPRELHQRVEWVFQMEEKIGGNLYLLEAWEAAVDSAGPNWRKPYEDLKILLKRNLQS